MPYGCNISAVIYPKRYARWEISSSFCRTFGSRVGFGFWSFQGARWMHASRIKRNEKGHSRLSQNSAIADVTNSLPSNAPPGLADKMTYSVNQKRKACYVQ